jgi:hypothetical protein
MGKMREAIEPNTILPLKIQTTFVNNTWSEILFASETAWRANAISSQNIENGEFND